jgi:hypothetical protein
MDERERAAVLYLVAAALCVVFAVLCQGTLALIALTGAH